MADVVFSLALVMWKAHLWVPVMAVVELCNPVRGGQKLGVASVGTTWGGALCGGG